jgi:transposase-like protein
MKSPPLLSCPNGCRTGEEHVKLVRYYGPKRTPLYRWGACGREFSARHQSVFSGLHTDEQPSARVLTALAEGTGLRAWARIFDLDKNTVVRILETAALPCHQVSEQLIERYHLEDCPVDELWSVVKKRKRLSRRWQSWPPAMATRGCGWGSPPATKS